MRFYVDILGFELMQRYGPSACFVSAGGYHHHIGLNTWAGVGAPPPPPGAIGLKHFDVRLPDDEAVAAVVARLTAAGIPMEAVDGGFLVRDPAKTAIRFTPLA
jgi:catechol 2,3-dioxygenase